MMEQETNLPNETCEVKGTAQAENAQTLKKRQEETAEIEVNDRETIASSQEECVLPEETCENRTEETVDELDVRETIASSQEECTLPKETCENQTEETVDESDVRETITSSQEECTLPKETCENQTEETVDESDVRETIASTQEECTLPKETCENQTEETVDESNDAWVTTDSSQEKCTLPEETSENRKEETETVDESDTGETTASNREEYDSPEKTAEEPVMQELPSSPDNFCGDLQEAIEVGAVGMLGKLDIIGKLVEINKNVDRISREQVDKLKQAYYRIIKAENDELKKIFVENGGDEADFESPEDETGQQFKDLYAEYKQKKAVSYEKEEKQKEENYVHKLQLIDRLQLLIESQDDFNKRYNEFKEIQQKWKEYDPIPQEYARDLWRKYQLHNERFYDLIKINNEFRDYDFKKNLELKTTLCEAIEKLADEPDAVSAYHQLQKLFHQWREIGPVAREYRETLWARFKEASTVINRKHQAHFEMLKSVEEENLTKKTALCEKVESIDFESLKTLKDWDRKTREVIDMQKNWRTIGFATKKYNTKIFDRFRKACDAYFEKKGVFYKSFKKELESNLQLKYELIAKAEELKNSSEWKETSKKLIELQAQWKNIGPVAHKHAEVVWQQFISACDYFFEQKNKALSSNRSEEIACLDTKRLLIKKISAIDENLSTEEALLQLKLLIAEWNTVGHVPFKEKDKIYKAFREAVNSQYERLNVAQTDRRIQQSRTDMPDNKDRNRLRNERDRLMRMYDRIKSELQTYENNVGFLNISSKGGGNLLKEMENKIERLREEMLLTVKKIDAIDENLED
ncbi:MAG: DUF349 domain-containing protein [Tannerella sp.]|jgi:hypothetical protein|nr:DUF349 domain-containing protein [Tannerella sp.]